MNIPNHVAIILDGNGRWAKAQGKPRLFGHKAGAKTLEKVCVDAYDLGVKVVTVYAFSTENWNRSETEVNGLLELLQYYSSIGVKLAADHNIRCHLIGDRSRLSESFQKAIAKVEDSSAKNTGLVLNIAINYGGRHEIMRAVKKIVNDGHNADEVTEDLIASYLDTAHCDDPDLLIRTGGEQRLSNFLLWQLAYSEFYFTDVYWPDFDKAELVKAIEWYNHRDRRFGGTNKATNE